jgi:hypothetical protein
MSEDRKDDAQQTGARIGELPASDQELNAEDRGSGRSGARSSPPPPDIGSQPSPEAMQPSPEAMQPSPDGGAQRTSPPPPDPEE